MNWTGTEAVIIGAVGTVLGILIKSVFEWKGSKDSSLREVEKSIRSELRAEIKGIQERQTALEKELEEYKQKYFKLLRNHYTLLAVVKQLAIEKGLDLPSDFRILFEEEGG